MDRLVAGTGDPYADQAVGDIAAHAASVVVDHDRELRVPFPGGMERITVVVAAEHQVDPGLVEHADAVRNSSERTAFFSHAHSSAR